MTLTRRAIAFAIKAHEGQVRRVSNLPYIVHPIECYSIVKKYKESHNIDHICAAAVLHDVAEDTPYTIDYIRDLFGNLVAELVQEVTTDAHECDRVGKEQYIDSKLVTMSSYGLVIKLADMLANITDNPGPKLIQRIKHHCEYVQAHRHLSQTHLKILQQIEDAIETLY